MLALFALEHLDSSPAPMFTPEPKSRKEKTGRRKWKKEKLEKLDLLTTRNRKELRAWVIENSMPEGRRNLTSADILVHISETYKISVCFCFFSHLFLLHFVNPAINCRATNITCTCC